MQRQNGQTQTDVLKDGKQQSASSPKENSPTEEEERSFVCALPGTCSFDKTGSPTFFFLFPTNV